MRLIQLKFPSYDPKNLQEEERDSVAIYFTNELMTYLKELGFSDYEVIRRKETCFTEICVRPKIETNKRIKIHPFPQ